MHDQRTNGGNAEVVVLCSFLALCFLGGGTAREDALSLLYLRPAAILYIGALVFTRRVELRSIRVPLFLLLAMALTMVVQLVPLPPEIWTRLASHERFVEAAAAAGLAQPWRPISVSPDLTLNSLVSLVVPAAVLLASSRLGPHTSRPLVAFLLAAIFASAILGVAQISGGSAGGLYLYRVTNQGMPVGLLANRNHQAALLACAFPLLAFWAQRSGLTPKTLAMRRAVAGIGGALLIPLIAVTGSRAGLLLGALGVLSVPVVLRLAQRGSRSDSARSSRGLAALQVAPWIAGALLLAAAVFLSRATAVQRLLAPGMEGDERISYLPVLLRIAEDFFPFGGGFGTFDRLYRIYEPFEHLGMSYLNHAHNDALELVMTGGIFAVAILAAFLFWYVRVGVSLARSSFRRGADRSLEAAAFMIMLLLLFSSVFDYPLRTPVLSALFALAAGWLAHGPAGSHSRGFSFTSNSREAIDPRNAEHLKAPRF